MAFPLSGNGSSSFHPFRSETCCHPRFLSFSHITQNSIKKSCWLHFLVDLEWDHILPPPLLPPRSNREHSSPRALWYVLSVSPLRPSPAVVCARHGRQSESLKIHQSIAFLRGNSRVLQSPQDTRDLSSLPSVRLCLSPAPKPPLTLTWLRGLWSSRASCCSVFYLEYSSPSCQMMCPLASPRSLLKPSSTACSVSVSTIIVFLRPSTT